MTEPHLDTPRLDTTHLRMLANSKSGASRSYDSIDAPHRVTIAAHELQALLDAAEPTTREPNQSGCYPGIVYDVMKAHDASAKLEAAREAVIKAACEWETALNSGRTMPEMHSPLIRAIEALRGAEGHQ